LIALFNGSGPTAAIVTDGSGNPLADADNLVNAPWSYVGNCPPGPLPLGQTRIAATTLCSLPCRPEPIPCC
jgi:hypothetical protein